MKRFLFGLFVLCEASLPCYSKNYKLNVEGIKNPKSVAKPGVASVKTVSTSDEKFVLMSPVKLNNPENVNYGFDAGLPLYYGETSSVKKVVKPVKKVEPIKVVEEKPTVLNMPVMEETKNVEANTQQDVKQDKKDDAKDTVKPDVKEEKVVAPEVKVEDKSKTEVKNSDDVATISQTDKNIDEAKKLLQVAENLAKSVAKEEAKEDKKVKTESVADVKVVKPVKQESVVAEIKKDVETQKNKVEKNVANPDVKVAGKLSNFSVKFNGVEENLQNNDVKKMNDVALQLAGKSDVNVKIISYYSSIDDRNVAFSRLLNTRKILLEKNVPTSQIMIMVLEDKAKTNTVDILFE